MLVILLVTAFNIFSVNYTQAAQSDKKDLFVVVRTIENGHTYISIYTDSGVLLFKDIEL